MSNLDQDNLASSHPNVVVPAPVTRGTQFTTFESLQGNRLGGDFGQQVESKTKNERPQKPRIVGHAIDTLELSLHVIWDNRWHQLRDELTYAKTQLNGSKGTFIQLLGVCRVVIHPKIQRESFAFRVSLGWCNLWLKNSQHVNEFASVVASIGSAKLWQDGVGGCVAAVCDMLRNLGGEVDHVMPIRVDLCVDVLIPRTLTQDWLTAHKKTRCKKIDPHIFADRFTGLEVGSGSLRLRIYDKAYEVAGRPRASWIYDCWQLPPGTPNIWRIEFQLRRKKLQEFGVNDLFSLDGYAAHIWRELTSTFFSLVYKRGKNCSRWQMVPLWKIVHGAADRFGNAQIVIPAPRAPCFRPTNEYIAQVAGCLVSYAACLGTESLSIALDDLIRKVRARLRHDFAERVRERQISHGQIPRT